MRWFHKCRCWLRNLINSGGQHDALEQELEQHLDIATAELVSQGMSKEEAHKVALKEFGNVEALKESCRDSWGMRLIDSTIRHLRLAGRQIRQHKGFSAVVVLTLGLGIGANTMVFALMNSVFFKPISVPNGDRLLTINGQDFSEQGRTTLTSYPDYQDFRNQNRTFDTIEAADPNYAVISSETTPATGYDMMRVSQGIFQMVETNPILGRTFSDQEHELGAPPVMVIGYELWRSRFNEDPEILGTNVRVNAVPTRIIGVMPEGFKFPTGQDCWMPLIHTEAMHERSHRRLQVFGILKQDISLDKARTDIATIAQRIALLPEANDDMGSLVQRFITRYNIPGARMSILAMQVSVVFVFLIACSNVANLFLGKGLKRRFEITVQAALGAKRGQIIRQLLIESFVLSVLGGLLGLGVAVFGIHKFGTAIQDELPYWLQFTMDYPVFAFFGGITLLSSLLFGLLPAYRITRIDLNTALKETSGISGGLSHGKLTSVMITLQLAATVVLLTNAGLLISSLLKQSSFYDFLPEKEIMTVNMYPEVRGTDRYKTEEERLQFFNRVLEETRSIPGVIHTALVSSLTGITDRPESRRVEVDRLPIESWEGAESTFISVHSPEVLDTINLPLVDGRRFSDADGESAEAVAIVSKEFAEKFWPQESAIDRRFRFWDRSGPGPWKRVVGVSSPVHSGLLGGTAKTIVFIPLNQEIRTYMMLLLRTNNDPKSYIQPLRSTVQQIDQDIALFNFRTMTELKGQTNWGWIAISRLFLIFAIIALLIASMGIYGVVSQNATNKTKELGIRKALGATAFRIQCNALSSGLVQLIAGMVIGLALALLLARFLTNLMQGVSPYDPVVYLGVLFFLGAVGLLACWLPARKAANINPSDTLRAD